MSAKPAPWGASPPGAPLPPMCQERECRGFGSHHEGAHERIADFRLSGMLDDQTARQLRTAASNVRTWTEKRNALIREAYLAGAGIRDIGRATGLNVGTIHTMLHGRKR